MDSNCRYPANFFGAPSDPHAIRLPQHKPASLATGTDGSNLSPSSGDLVRTLLPLPPLASWRLSRPEGSWRAPTSPISRPVSWRSAPTADDSRATSRRTASVQATPSCGTPSNGWPPAVAAVGPSDEGVRAKGLSPARVTTQLIFAALKTAKRARAPALEGYPIDTSAPKSTSNIFTGYRRCVRTRDTRDRVKVPD
jgi:hypothetical protein